MTQTLQKDTPGLQVELLHHVSLPVRDLEISRRFYAEVLSLREIPRPDFAFAGAWFQVAAGQLHLIVRAPGVDPKDASRPEPTYRLKKGIDTRDIHFAVRVKSFSAALTHLNDSGYGENAEGKLKIQVNRPSKHRGAGFPQIYVLDPDGHVIEINAQSEDS
ncbi:MAG TPA: VOC family protein [Ensifer sp.]|jgi:catechol 2,3-dioxygenase-like lactoylglutathione lyase family enzyme|uniref:VOC family protein n=1 Tax=Ensifer sp. TaxID=1872086 RepID=UPI002E0F0093|nr:VOC family protein [Ensifer sp.]